MPAPGSARCPSSGPARPVSPRWRRARISPGCHWRCWSGCPAGRFLPCPWSSGGGAVRPALVLRRSAESLAPACALRDMLGDTAPWSRNDTTSSAAWRSPRRQGPAWRQRLTLTEQTPVRVIGRVERKLLAPALAGGLKPSPGTGFDAADGFAFGVVSPAAGVSVPDDEGSTTDSGSQWPGGRPLRVRRCTTCSGGSLCVPAFRPAMPNLMG